MGDRDRIRVKDELGSGSGHSQNQGGSMWEGLREGAGERV